MSNRVANKISTKMQDEKILTKVIKSDFTLLKMSTRNVDLTSLKLFSVH